MRFLPKVKIFKTKDVLTAAIGPVDIISFKKGMKYIQLGNYYLIVKSKKKPLPIKFFCKRYSAILRTKRIDFGKTKKPFKIKNFLEMNDAIRTGEGLRRQRGPLLSKA